MRRQHVATGVSLWVNAIKNEAAIAAAEMGNRFQSKVAALAQVSLALSGPKKILESF
jgi:hypothetical protein